MNVFQFFGKVMRRFDNKVVLHLLGWHHCHSRVFLADQVAILDQPEYGITMLLLFGVLKVVLLALSFKSGYLGGPIFPVLFSCTMIGLALNLAFPGLPVIIAVLCLEAAAISLVLGAPLSAILLVTVVAEAGQITPYLIALIVVATVTSMILGAILKKLMTKRKATA
jgi:H+/Cl- antiporter ClcA